MMRKIIALAVASSLFAIGSAQAKVEKEEAATEEKAKPAKKKKLSRRDPNYVRCRKILYTGSRVNGRKVCKTNAEWEASRRRGQEKADQMVQEGIGGVNGN